MKGGGETPSIKCNLCHAEWKGGYTRVKAQLMNIAKKGVEFCTGDDLVHKGSSKGLMVRQASQSHGHAMMSMTMMSPVRKKCHPMMKFILVMRMRH